MLAFEMTWTLVTTWEVKVTHFTVKSLGRNFPCNVICVIIAVELKLDQAA